MTADGWLHTTGIVLVIVGVMFQFLCGAACNSYELRRRLPLKSPLELQATGCCFFMTGLLLIVCGKLF